MTPEFPNSKQDINSAKKYYKRPVETWKRTSFRGCLLPTFFLSLFWFLKYFPQSYSQSRPVLDKSWKQPLANLASVQFSRWLLFRTGAWKVWAKYDTAMLFFWRRDQRGMMKFPRAVTMTNYQMKDFPQRNSAVDRDCLSNLTRGFDNQRIIIQYLI